MPEEGAASSLLRLLLLGRSVTLTMATLLGVRPVMQLAMVALRVRE